MSDNGTIVLDGLVLSGGENISPEIASIITRLNSVEGRGGYLQAYNFGVDTPTATQLNDYALSQIPSISNPSEIFNGTRVKNTFNNNLWVLANTPNTIPPVFEWINNGLDTVSIATTETAGVVKASSTSGRIAVAADGTASVNGFNDKYDKSGGTITGNLTINRSAATSAISLVSGSTYNVLEGSAASISLYRSDRFVDRLSSVLSDGKVKWYVYKNGVAKELGLTDASEISYSGTLSSTTVKNAIEEVDGKIEELTGIVDETAVSLPVNYRQIASKTCTSMSETSLLDTTGARGTNIIPANKLQVGDVIMIDIEGQISGISAATATLNIKYGSTVIATLAKPFTDTYDGIHFDVKATATVRAIGATGKLVLSGLVYLRNRAVQGSGITWPIGGISEVTINTTAESALDATIAWSAENAGNTITASQFVISSLLR